MSRHNCNICNERLLDSINGQLDDGESLLFQRHLDESPSCAREAARLRAFVQSALPRDGASVGLPDPGAFLAGVNAGIDRKYGSTKTQHPFFSVRWRPAFAIPLLAAMLLVAAGVVWLNRAGDDSRGNDPFHDLLTAEDIRGLENSEDVTSLLERITIGDLSSATDTRIEDILPAEDLPGLAEEIDITLFEDVAYSDVVSASLEYLSPLEAAETLAPSEIDAIVASLEHNRFTLL